MASIHSASSSSVKPGSKHSALRMSDQHAPEPEPAPAGKSRRWMLLIPVAMMGMGYLVGGFFVKAAPKAAEPEHQAPEHRTDPTIDETMAEQRWKDALGKIRSDLKTAAGPENTALRFREAICQERLGDYQESCKSYGEVVAAEPSTVRGTAARIGWARGQIKLNRIPEARAALCRLVLLSGDDAKNGSPLHADLLATLAHAEYLSGGVPATPHPLEPYLPATTEKVPDLEQLVVWAGVLKHVQPKKKAHGSGHGDAGHGEGHGDAGHGDAGHGDAAHAAEHADAPHDSGHEETSHGGGIWHRAMELATPRDHPVTPKGDAHSKKDDHKEHPAPMKAAEDTHGKEAAPAKKDPHDAKPAAKPEEHPEEHHDQKAPAAKEAPGAKSAPKHEDHAADDGHGKPTPAAKDDSHGPKPAPAKEDSHAPKPAPAKNTEDAHAKKPTAKENIALPKGEMRIGVGPTPGEWVVTTDIQSRGLQSVVEMLARELGLSLKLTGKAGELLSGRAANIVVRELSAGLILDALLWPADLEWTIQDLDLIISPAKTGDAAWRTRCRTALTRALAAGTDHPWRTGLTIDLGNLDFLAKSWKAAADTYIKALDEGGLKPEAIAGSHNLGLACFHLSLRDRAREQFQNLADRDTSGRWGALAYWWAGRTHLDADEPEKAVRYFEASIATGETSPAVTASGLGLSFCYLLRSDYRSAQAALRPHRTALKTPDYKITAAFADGLCRYKLAENPKVTGEADELLYAVLNAGEELAVGPAGAYLLGKTCRELGFGPRMAAIYGKTLENLRGALAVRMTGDLADYHYANGDPAQAAEGYRAVATVNREEPGRHAWLQLARIALLSKKPEEAARCCAEAMRVGADKTAVLNELGRIYEFKKDYKRAAKCFGGEFP